MFERIVWLSGMPRSGTNWGSQILASHPEMRVKFCPLFSYAFKNRCDESSTAQEWRDFFRDVYHTADEYMDQDYLRRDGNVPSFAETSDTPSVLCIKSTRYHHLTPHLIDALPELQFIALVRNPAASIHSWLANPLEFPEGADPQTEWRSGACRKTAREEYWGFEDWKSVTRQHLALAASHPDRLRLISYEDLVADAPGETARLFDWLKLDMHPQTTAFLSASQSQHTDHKRAVFKDPKASQRWRAAIDPQIRLQIGKDLAGTKLARFCDDETLANGAAWQPPRTVLPERQEKRGPEDFAAFGGAPLFSPEHVRPIGQLARPAPARFAALIDDAYAAHRLSNNGALCQQLEKALAERHGVRECLVFANASLALIALLQLVARPGGREVLLPAYTYVGLPHIIRWAGLEPVFCDVDPVRHTIDPAAAARLAGGQTAAILAVHQVNAPCDHDAFAELSRHTEIPVVYDSVHALGCTLPDGTPIGDLGVAEVFSLHATKLLNGFEGGYITTEDAALAERLRSARNFGFTGELTVSGAALNGKLNEIHAAAALASLDHLDDVIDRNKARFDAYARGFEGIPDVSLIPYTDHYGRKNYEFALLQLGPNWPLGRDETVSLLRAENALTRAYYNEPLYIHGDYPAPGSGAKPNLPRGLEMPHMPVTDRLARNIIQLPVGERLAAEDIAAITSWFGALRDNAAAVTARIRGEAVPVW